MNLITNNIPPKRFWQEAVNDIFFFLSLHKLVFFLKKIFFFGSQKGENETPISVKY